MISSVSNPLVQRARKLRKPALRARAREFLVEGANGIAEALAAGVRLELLLITEPPPESMAGLVEAARTARIPVQPVSPSVMEAISGTETPPGAVAIAPFVDQDLDSLLGRCPDLVVVLAQVRDPGNLGTILRTAQAAGAGAVVLTEGTVDVYNPKVVRATAGAIFRLSFAREVAIPWVLSELGKRGIRRIGADPLAAATYDEVDMTGSCALVFGNEAWGLTEEVRGGVDELARIPMQASAESLNVAVCAAVLLFEAGRQRRGR